VWREERRIAADTLGGGQLLGGGWSVDFGVAKVDHQEREGEVEVDMELLAVASGRPLSSGADEHDKRKLRGSNDTAA
jgi:hypothetical protein